jgi:hypothetical protein
VDAQAINKGLWMGGWWQFKRNSCEYVDVSESVIKFIARSNGYRIESKSCDYTNTQDIKIDRKEIELFYD